MAGRAPKTSSPGGAVPATARFAVIAGRFNEPISKKLVDGALGAFAERGVAASAIEVHWVPGSFELPIAALALARSRRYAGLVCVGVVIRGATPHFEHVTREAAAGIRQVGLTTGVPVGFGVITALDEGQAWERAGGAVGNRGEEAALAVHEMVGFLARAKANGRAGRRRGGRG